MDFLAGGEEFMQKIIFKNSLRSSEVGMEIQKI
jgi:hypothetical protein